MENLNQELPALPEPEENKSAVEERQTKQKAVLIEQLKKFPIVQAACEREGVSRATFYRWKKDDSKFAEEVEQATVDGSCLMNDLAESQLLSCIKDREFPSIAFWLKHRHPKFAPKLEVTAKVEMSEDHLTPEDAALKRQGLELAVRGIADDILKPRPQRPSEVDRQDDEGLAVSENPDQ
jgi:hypothetical protein